MSLDLDTIWPEEEITLWRDPPAHVIDWWIARGLCLLTELTRKSELEAGQQQFSGLFDLRVA